MNAGQTYTSPRSDVGAGSILQSEREFTQTQNMPTLISEEELHQAARRTQGATVGDTISPSPDHHQSQTTYIPHQDSKTKAFLRHI